MPNPEELSHKNIDKQLKACGWDGKSRIETSPCTSLGVEVYEFPLETGEAEYVLFVDHKTVGVVKDKFQTWLNLSLDIKQHVSWRCLYEKSLICSIWMVSCQL